MNHTPSKRYFSYLSTSILIALFMFLAVPVSAETTLGKSSADLLRQDIINTEAWQPSDAPTNDFNMRGGVLLAENFDGITVPALPTGWITDNVNADIYSWVTADAASQTPSNAARIRWNSAADMDDWLISPSFSLTGGTEYRLTFYYRSGGTFPENLEVMYGTSVAPADLTNLIVDLNGINTTTWEQSQTTFTPGATDTYYLGFHGYSAADQFYLYVDSIVLEENPAGAPDCANVVAPINMAIGAPANSMLEWSASLSGAVATAYTLSFGTDNPPTNIEDGTALGNTLTYTPTTALNYGTTYYWQGVPSNAEGSATDCPIWSFTVEDDPLVSTFPYLETFGDSTCVQPSGWTQDAANEEDWLFAVPGNAANPAEYGADVDHTDGSGCIAWIDSSSPYNANPAALLSPPFDLTALTAPVLEFWYQNQSASSSDASFSTLSVDVYDGSAWVTNVLTVGEKIADWTMYSVDLTSYSSAATQLRFNGTEQQAWFDSDMSLDDVSVKETPNDDLGIVSFVSPGSGCNLSAAEAVTVVIENFGVNPASDFNLTVSVDSVGQGTSSLAGPLAAGASDQFTFDLAVDLSAAGTHTVTAALDADDNSLNDTLEIVVENLGQTPLAVFPYIESFEGTDGGWIAGGVNNSWERGVPGDTSISSAYDGSEVWATGLITDYVSNEQSYVQSPCLDFSALTEPQISMGFNVDSEFSFDGAALQYSTDGTATWTTVGAPGDDFIWYNDGTISGLGWSGSDDGWSGTSGGNWLPAAHELDALAGEPAVILRVAFGSDGSTVDEGMAFDLVKIEDGRPEMGAITTEVTSTLGISATADISIMFENVGDATMSYSIYEGTCATGTDVPWITGLSPELGTLDAANSQSITVGISSSGLMTGTYTGTVCVFSSDVNDTRAVREVTVNLVVDPNVTVVGLGSTAAAQRHSAVPIVMVVLFVMTLVIVAMPTLRRQRSS